MSSWYNLLRTRAGHLYVDFEEVTAGPVEWDVALLPGATEAYGAAAARAGLRALDRDALCAVTAAARLNMVAALAFAPQRPMLVDALAPSIAHWRSTPFAGGAPLAAVAVRCRRYERCCSARRCSDESHRPFCRSRSITWSLLTAG